MRALTRYPKDAIRAGVLVLAGLALLASFVYSATADPEVLNWARGDFSSTARIMDLSFADAASGLAVGTDGTIARTRDGGDTWESLDSTVTADLYGIDRVGGRSWAVGAGGVVLSSHDGTAWNAEASGVATDLLGVDFVDGETGWAVGRGGTVVTTADGGSTWTTPTVPATATLYGVSFVTTSTGWAWGAEGIVVRTTDGGASWETASAAATGTSLFAGSFIDTSTGWVAGSGGALLRTVDGGSTWTAQDIGITADINAIDFVDAQHGVVVGSTGAVSGVILTTSDGGATWTQQAPGVEASFDAVEFLDATTGWAAGGGGTILRTFADAAPSPDPELPVAPTAVYARALASGPVMLGWSEVTGTVDPVRHRVWRSIDGGAYSSLGTVTGLSYTDATAPALKSVAYRVSVIDQRGEGQPSPPATVTVRVGPTTLPQRPENMSCQGCHPAHRAVASEVTPFAAKGRCHTCHASDIGERLSGEDAGTRHDLLVDDQLVAGTRMTCQNCHQPHATSETTPSVDPDAPGTGMERGSDALCLRCHDTELPDASQTGTWAPAPLAAGGGTSATNIAFAWAGAAHGAGASTSPLLRQSMGYLRGDTLGCASCHDAHGSTNRWSLLETVSSSADTTRATGLLVRPMAGGGADLRLFCASCHSLTTHPAADLTQWPLDCTTCHSHLNGGL